MHEQSRPEKSEEFARLDGAILGLLVDKQRHPWPIDEIEREIGSESINVPPAIHRLDEAGLLHSWDHFVCLTHAAIRCREIMDNDEADRATCLKGERLVLFILLALDAGASTSEGVLRANLRHRGTSNEANVSAAVARLDGAGLLVRRGREVAASPAAARFNLLNTL